MRMNHLIASALCTIAIFGASGCPKRVPATPDQPTSPPTTDQPVTPPVTEPPVTPPVSEPPVVQPPVVQPPVTEPPVVQPPVVQPPVTNPPTTPNPTPTPTNPPADGDNGNDDKPPAKPEPTPEKIFVDTLLNQVGGWNHIAVINDMRNAIKMPAEGWSKGDQETPEAYIQKMFDLSFRSFPDWRELTVEQYKENSLRFANETRATFDHHFYVDLKVTKERGEMYVLRLNPKNRQVIGIKKGDADYVGVAPFTQVEAQQVYRQSDAGKIFLYTYETQEFLSNEKRFLRVPEMFLFNDWDKRFEAQQKAAVEQQRVMQQRAVMQQQYVGYNTYPQQSRY